MEDGYNKFLFTQNLIEYVRQLLNQDVTGFYPTIYSMVSGAANEKDVENIVHFITKVYECGFNKSTEAHQAVLEKFNKSISRN